MRKEFCKISLPKACLFAATVLALVALFDSNTYLAAHYGDVQETPLDRTGLAATTTLKRASSTAAAETDHAEQDVDREAETDDAGTVPAKPATTKGVKSTTKAAKAPTTMRGCKFPKMKWRKEGFRSAEPAQQLMRQGKPVLWLRIADGDMIQAADYSKKSKDGTTNPEMLRQDFKEYGSIHPNNTFVSLGYWWLCNGATKTQYWEGFNKLLHGKDREMHKDFAGFSNEFYLNLVPNGKKGLNRTRGAVVPLLRERIVYLVGPDYLNKLKVMFGHKGHLGGCSLEGRQKVWQAMRDASARHPDDNVVFLVTCGPPVKPVLWRIWKELGHKDTFVDIGTQFEGFSGVKTRDHHNIAKLCKEYPDYMVPGACAADSTTQAGKNKEKGLSSVKLPGR
eukprot:TRINITY_DN80012_c0_g1_i1.p1 TRINITY_DN80012_c0_g1~~TRINITY_DN80012_c0_g1_i1.p1  ORF type:complete len:394 (-),score=64.29 TRINITY_DN80012_c0_g1_i1:259-1440(-)